MNEPLPEDVVNRVREEYKERADEVLLLLLARREIGSGEFFGDRLIRCVVFAAKGNLSRISELIALGLRDYRDLIMAGEYDHKSNRRRDLTASFLVDGDQNFWIADLAELMASRGYRLTTLEIHPDNSSRAEKLSENISKRATFVGAKGTIQIELKQGLWRICGDLPTLELHDLNRKFEDGRAFRDAVSALLLSRYPLPEPGNWEEPAPPVPPPPRPWWKFWG